MRAGQANPDPALSDDVAHENRERQGRRYAERCLASRPAAKSRPPEKEEDDQAPNAHRGSRKHVLEWTARREFLTELAELVALLGLSMKKSAVVENSVCQRGCP